MRQDSLQEHIDLLDTLSRSSNSRTGRPRKSSPPGRRIDDVYVLLPMSFGKVSRKSYVRSTSLDAYPRYFVFVGFTTFSSHKPFFTKFTNMAKQLLSYRYTSEIMVSTFYFYICTIITIYFYIFFTCNSIYQLILCTSY